MPDPADLAEREIENHLRTAMARRAARSLPERGACYNCGEPLPSGLYCDADCGEDHERRTASRRASFGG